MAFLDKIGEKISSGANAVTVSTKKMTESARINGEITANKAEINKLMQQLGVYVKSHLMSEIKDEEALAIAARIDGFIARNVELAEELQKVKGIRRCTACSAELPPNSMFCPNCGTKYVPPQPEPVQPTVQAVKVANPSANPAAEQPMQSAAAYIFCTECGNREPAGSVFCTNCGRRLQV